MSNLCRAARDERDQHLDAEYSTYCDPHDGRYVYFETGSNKLDFVTRRFMSNPAMHESSSDRPGVFYGYVIVAAGCFSMALIFSVHYAFGVFFKPLSASFGWTRAMTAGAFSLVWITQGLLSIVMGGLNDKFGPRVVLTIGALLIGGGYLLTSQTHSILEFYVYYGILVGAGLGSTFVPLTSTTARWFVKRRGVMTGIVASGVGVGALVGPPVANWLIANYNWRVSYHFMGVIVLVGVLVTAQFLRRDPAQMGTRPYGAGEGDRLYVKVGAYGLSLREAAKTWQFWIVSLIFFFYGYTWTAILLHLAPHATDLGISASNAANMISVLGGASILGKVLLGVMADKIGNKKVYLLSFAMMVISLLRLTTITRAGTFDLFALFFGFAYGGLATANSPLVAWLFGMRKHGLIYGICFNGFTIGCAAGPVLSGHIFDVTHSYRLAFFLCSASALAGLLLTLLLKPALLPETLLPTPVAGVTLVEEKTV
jgi:MFS family permease